MKFNYKDFSTITLKGHRWYKINEKLKYPSITTILGNTMTEEKKQSLENWRQSLGPKKADAYTKQCGDRGTVVHLLIEKFLKGEDLKDVKANTTELNMFNSMKLSLKKIDEVYGQEISLYSDVLKIAGRTDCIGIFKGVESIIDFKTSTRAKTKFDIDDYWLQCCFYAMSHNELYGTDITHGVILMGVEQGLPQVFEKDLIPFIGPLVKRIEAFYKGIE